jgi:hypothetical protein
VEVPGAHPGPPADLHARTPLVRESAGPWVRFHDVRHRPLHFSRGGTSRVNDPGGEFGVLYAADGFPGAFIETFGRRLDVRSITASSLRTTGVAAVTARSPLKLIDLASTGALARLSADAQLMSGDIAVARQWSRALWQHPITADGLYYRLRHDPEQCACALFNRARKALTVQSQGTVSDRRHREALTAALDRYQFGFIQDEVGRI